MPFRAPGGADQNPGYWRVGGDAPRHTALAGNELTQGFLSAADATARRDRETASTWDRGAQAGENLMKLAIHRGEEDMVRAVNRAHLDLEEGMASDLYGVGKQTPAGTVTSPAAGLGERMGQEGADATGQALGSVPSGYLLRKGGEAEGSTADFASKWGKEIAARKAQFFGDAADAFELKGRASALQFERALARHEDEQRTVAMTNEFSRTLDNAKSKAAVLALDPGPEQFNAFAEETKARLFATAPGGKEEKQRLIEGAMRGINTAALKAQVAADPVSALTKLQDIQSDPERAARAFDAPELESLTKLAQKAAVDKKQDALLGELKSMGPGEWEKHAAARAVELGLNREERDRVVSQRKTDWLFAKSRQEQAEVDQLKLMYRDMGRVYAKGGPEALQEMSRKADQDPTVPLDKKLRLKQTVQSVVYMDQGMDKDPFEVSRVLAKIELGEVTNEQQIMGNPNLGQASRQKAIAGLYAVQVGTARAQASAQGKALDEERKETIKLIGSELQQGAGKGEMRYGVKLTETVANQIVVGLSSWARETNANTQQINTELVRRIKLVDKGGWFSGPQVTVGEIEQAAINPFGLPEDQRTKINEAAKGKVPPWAEPGLMNYLKTAPVPPGTPPGFQYDTSPASLLYMFNRIMADPRFGQSWLLQQTKKVRPGAIISPPVEEEYPRRGGSLR